MDGGLGSRCVGHVYGADGAVRTTHTIFGLKTYQHPCIRQLVPNGRFFFRQLLQPSSTKYDTLCHSVIYLYFCRKLVPVIA